MAAGHMLLGRRSECEQLDQLLETVRGDGSRVLVVRGEPGVGKSALLEYLVGNATGFRIARAAGAECEMELPFAGLHQLCAPMLGRLSALPAPQRDALATVFGLNGHEAPDRFLVGLAGLGLLSGAAERRPLLCVVDDGQWLDRASAEALAFVARRVPAEPIALVFAVRDPTETRELAGLPELVVGGLSDVDARTMLDSTIRGLIDERVRDRIVAEARGNPLAMLELPGGLTPAELAGGVGRPDTMPIGLRDTPAVTEADPRGTRVVVAGVSIQPDTVHPLYGIVKEVNIQFVWGYDPNEFAESLRAISDGEIDVTPLITGEVGLDEIGAAFDELARPGAHCKILVTP